MKYISSKIVRYFCLLLVLLVLTLPFTGILLYDYWKGFVDDDKGYNSISVVISYAGGIVNLVTIIFLYINFREQREANDRNNQNTEYNRILDFIYRHFEKTKINLEELAESRKGSALNQKIKWTLEDYKQRLCSLLSGERISKDNLGDLLDKNNNMVQYLINYRGRLDTYIDRFDYFTKIYLRLVYNNEDLNNNSKSSLNLIIHDLFLDNELHKIITYRDYLKNFDESLSFHYEDYYKEKETGSFTKNAENLSRQIKDLIDKIDNLYDVFDLKSN
ncbi:hypothetical protein [Sphingobacterium sp.]|uniref:hypothetical protein n=1 Tax=Sphingobacterium sp. TaxID=341027 RepID=UPI0031D5AC0B